MDITSLLAGSIPSEQEYYAEDPYYAAGQNILGFRAKPTNDWEAILGPVLQGLAGGTLTGYGKRQAGQAAFDDARQSPLIAPYLQEAQFVGQRPEGEVVPEIPESLAMYLQEEAPEGFTPNKARESILMGLLQQEQAQQIEVEKQKQQAELQKQLLPYSEQVIQAKARGVGLEEKAKQEAISGALGYNPKVEEETDKLRKEFNALPEAKNFALVEKAGKTIYKAIADPSAVSDQELVRYSIQLIEPGMAVREGEQAAVAASQSIPEEWKGALNKAFTSGTKLGPDVREGLKRLADRAYQGNKEQYDRAFEFYKNEATSKNLDPNRISHIGESTPSLATKQIGGRTYYKVNGGWQAK